MRRYQESDYRLEISPPVVLIRLRHGWNRRLFLLLEKGLRKVIQEQLMPAAPRWGVILDIHDYGAPLHHLPEALNTFFTWAESQGFIAIGFVGTESNLLDLRQFDLPPTTATHAFTEELPALAWASAQVARRIKRPEKETIASIKDGASQSHILAQNPRRSH